MKTKQNLDRSFIETKYIVTKIYRHYDEWIEESELIKFLDYNLNWARSNPGRFLGVQFNGKGKLRFTNCANDWYNYVGDRSVPILIIANPNKKKYNVLNVLSKHVFSKSELISFLITKLNLS